MNIQKDSIDMAFIKKWMDKGMNPIVLSILYRRGVKDDFALFNFFNKNSFGCLPSPFILNGLEKAYLRINESIKNKQKVLLFGDRDVDGITSVYIMYDFLKKIGVDIEYLVPVGEETYSISLEDAIKWVGKYDLLITVDCGITNSKEVDFLNENGIDTIIIDHHQVHDNIPTAYTIINPKYSIDYDFSDMAACVVSFLFSAGYHFFMSPYYNKVYLINYNKKFYIKNLMFVEADKEAKDLTDYLDYSILQNSNDEIIQSAQILNIFREKIIGAVLDMKSAIELYVQFAAIGTLADIMPLRDINRMIVALGVDSIKINPVEPLRILIERLGIDKSLLSSTDLSWKIIPILNSAGRMGDARVAIEFLQHPNENIYNSLVLMNDERKKAGDEAFKFFISSMENKPEQYNNLINLYYSDSIQRGVLGITANKLTDYTGKPSVVCLLDNDFVIGSMRGIAGIHLVSYLTRAKDLLEEFGGHEFAAGFRMRKENFEKFCAFIKNTDDLDAQHAVEKKYIIDAEIPLGYLNETLYKDLSVLEPYGENNDVPILYTTEVTIERYMILGKDKSHLKFVINTTSGSYTAVYWGKAEWFSSVHKPENKYAILYTMELNQYKNVVSLQLKIIDMETIEY